MLVGIVGKKRSGKDTFADYVITTSEKTYIKYSFADPLKEICKILFLFNDEQLYGNDKEVIDSRWGVSPRKVLQIVGTDLFRNTLPTTCEDLSYIKDNFWIKQFNNWYESNKHKNIIIPDIRFQNEIDIIKENNGIIIHIINDNVNMNDTHSSETNELSGFDIEVSNNETLNDYYHKINNIIKDYKL